MSYTHSCVMGQVKDRVYSKDVALKNQTKPVVKMFKTGNFTPKFILFHLLTSHVLYGYNCGWFL